MAGISNISGIQGGVYIKYNAASRSATVDTYSGACRGVLLQLGLYLIIDVMMHTCI